MIAPAVAAALISSVPAVTQMVTGLFQNRRAKKELGKLQDPGFEIPKEATEALSLARTQAGKSEMPGMSSMVDRVNQIAGQGYNMAGQYATSAPQALGAMTGIAANQTANLLDVEGQNAAWMQDRMDRYGDALNTYADWQNRKQQYAQNRYLREATAISGLGGAGMYNTQQGISSLAGVGANYYAGQAQQNSDQALLDRLLGAQGSGVGSGTGSKEPALTDEQIDYLMTRIGLSN